MRTSLLAGAILLFGVFTFPASAQTEHTTSTYDVDTQSINSGPMPGLSTSFSETLARRAPSKPVSR